MDLRRAIWVLTQLWHGFPYRTNWVEAPHAKLGKRHNTNNNARSLDICLSTASVAVLSPFLGGEVMCGVEHSWL